jgi:hypothetical protein
MGDINARVNYYAYCVGPDGLKWEDRSHNTVTTAGKNQLLATGLGNGSQVTLWYVGLKGTGAVVAGDTLNSHAGWSELSTIYVAATRSVWTAGVPAAGSVNNSAATAAFSINTTSTVYGAFLASSPAASLSTQTLYSAADFAAARSVASSDTLNIVATFTIT